MLSQENGLLLKLVPPLFVFSVLIYDVVIKKNN